MILGAPTMNDNCNLVIQGLLGWLSQSGVQLLIKAQVVISGS